MNIRTVHLYVFDNMADWEADFAVAVINNQTGPGRYRVVKAAATLVPVTTMGGARIWPDVTLGSLGLDSCDLLILPGGWAWENGENAEALELAVRFIALGVPVAAICAAAMALSRTGVFDQLRHTGITREYVICTGCRGAAFYCGAPAVKDAGLITASGLAPVEFAREIFKGLDIYSPAAPEVPHSMFRQCGAPKFSTLAAN